MTAVMTDRNATIADQAFPEQWVICPEPFLSGREKAVDRLLYGVLHHHRIQLLSGPAGAGKSIALRRLEKRLRGRLLLICVDAAATADKTMLLRQLGNGINASTNGDGLDDAISERLRQLTDEGKSALLLIDNGDELDQDSLTALLALSQAGQPRPEAPLAVVIACSTGFAAERTADRRYWQGVALSALSLVGTGRYLQDRLSRVGIRGQRPFNRAVVEAIHAQTGGWPGAIDEQARATLSDSGPLLLSTEFRLSRRMRVTGLLLLLLVLAGLGWKFREPLRELGGSLTDDLRENLPAPASTPERSPEAAARLPVKTPPMPTGPGDTSASPLPVSAAMRTDLSPAAAQQSPAAEAISEPVPKPVPAKPSEPATEQTQQPAAPAPASEPESAPEQPLQPHSSGTSPAHAIVHLQSWIEAQPPNAWTLQVFTANSEAHLLNLTSSIGIAGDWAYYHINQNNKDWYTLLYGSFSSRKAALAASTSLKAKFGDVLPLNYARIHKRLGVDR